MTVRTVTIDQLQLGNPTLIKIDAEGMEYSVIRGARDTLRSSSCVVSAECNSLESGLKVLELAKQAGLEIFVLQAPAFNTANYRGNTHNIFGSANEVSLILIPQNSRDIVRARLGPAYAALKPLATADDLALYLLRKPQYKYEVLAQCEASVAKGVDFWANEPEVCILRTTIAEKEANIATLPTQLQSDRQLLQGSQAETVRLLQASHAETISILTNRHEILASDLAVAKNRNASLADALSHRESDLAAATSEIEQIKSEAERLRGVSDLRSAELSQALGRLAGRESEIVVLQAKAELLAQLVRSRGWRTLSTYYAIRDKLHRNIAELSAVARIVVRNVSQPSADAHPFLSLRHLVRISRSGLWYNNQYPDVFQSGMDPLVHFVLFGSHEARNPTANKHGPTKAPVTKIMSGVLSSLTSD